MQEKHCLDCKNFLQHYTFNSRKIFRVYCGHCTLTPTKRMKPDAVACEKYLPAPSPKDTFVSKEYLSKELLRYMLSLELLPEIEEGGWGFESLNPK